MSRRRLDGVSGDPLDGGQRTPVRKVSQEKCAAWPCHVLLLVGSFYCVSATRSVMANFGGVARGSTYTYFCVPACADVDVRLVDG